MSSLSDPFIRRPVMTTLLTLSAILFGIVAYRSLPVNGLPNIEYPVITVSTSYPGMDPETMASSIVSPLESQFLQLDGIQIVTSKSQQGSASITLQFDLSRNIDAAASDVQAAINAAQPSLPSDLPNAPTYSKVNPNNAPILYLSLISDTFTNAALYDYANIEIAKRLSVLPGVANVAIYGTPRAIRINVDMPRLYNLGLTLSDITQAVQSNTVSISAGSLNGNYSSFILNPKGQLTKAEEYGNIIVAHRNNAPIYLHDIAECLESVSDTDVCVNIWIRNKKPTSAGLVLAINTKSGANTIEVAQDVKALIATLQSEIPSSVDLGIIYDESILIEDSISEVQQTLFIAFVLVVMVIFLFLGRARDTIIPTVALPISLLLTFIIMKMVGYSLDNLSLMALTLSIGFLVDDAIVFLENMVRHMEEGESPLQASLNSAKEISFTILAMTISLAAVFIPLVFMEGLMGRIFREFSITIVIATLCSGVVSLTLTPMMCARMLKARDKNNKTKLERMANRIEGFCLHYYDKTLSFFLTHKYISAIVWVICLLGTIALFYFIPKTFLPVGDSGFIQSIFIAQDGASPDQMKRFQSQIDQVFKNNDSVEQFVTVSGVGQFMASNQGFAFAFLKDIKERPPIQWVNRQIQMEFFKIPGLLAFAKPQPVLEIPTGDTDTNQGNYAFSMSSVNANELYDSAQQLIEKMRQIPGIVSINPDFSPNTPYLNIEFLRDQASRVGISAFNIENMFKNAFSQNYVYLIKSDVTLYQVIVNAAPYYSRSPEDFSYFYIPSGIDKKPVPLSSLINYNPGLSLLSVGHINNLPSVTIYYNLAPGFPMEIASKKISEAANEVAPPTVFKQFLGTADVFAQTVKSLSVLILVAIFVMYVVLGILYESYIHPLTVLSALPVATVGGLLTLLLFQAEFSLYAFVGIFMLMGIVKKNGIMMIDFAIMRQNQGMAPRAAVHEACLERFRPIMMTTLAAFMGAVPIAMGWGTDGASRRPLGLTILGGLLVSQLLTLYVTPAIYLYFEAFQEKVLDHIPFFSRKIGNKI